MEPLTPYLIAIPALLILSIVASKGAGRFGIPALSIFLLIGMIVGREGPGGFPFSNCLLAQTLGIIALILILHSGGLSTTLDDVRAVRAARSCCRPSACWSPPCWSARSRSGS